MTYENSQGQPFFMTVGGELVDISLSILHGMSLQQFQEKYIQLAPLYKSVGFANASYLEEDLTKMFKNNVPWLLPKY